LYSRGFSRPCNGREEKLTYPKKDNNVIGESVSHIWGTEIGEELELPIINYPDPGPNAIFPTRTANNLTKVRLVGTVQDFIDMVPVAYKSMKLRCAMSNRIVRIFRIVRDENLNPMYVLFDDSCLGGDCPTTQFKMELNLNVYFNEWQSDEVIYSIQSILLTIIV